MFLEKFYVLDNDYLPQAIDLIIEFLNIQTLLLNHVIFLFRCVFSAVLNSLEK